MPSLWSLPEAGFGYMAEKGVSWEADPVNNSEPEESAALSPTACSSDAQSNLERNRENNKNGLESSSNSLPDTHSDIPFTVAGRLIYFPRKQSRQPSSSPRMSCSETTETATALSPSAANFAPPEILLQIFSMLSPRDFENARRTCSQWMRVSLNQGILEGMLKRAGWWDAWQRDCQTERPPISDYEDHSLVWRMSRRFATECVLSGRKFNVEKQGFLTTTFIDFSKLSQNQPSPRYRGPACHLAPAANMTKFNVSNCGNYLLVTSGSTIYVYHLRTRKSGNSLPVCTENMDITPIASIACPVEVLSATIDTSSPRLVVAALLRNRVGMICDLVPSSNSTSHRTEKTSSSEFQPMRQVDPSSRHYYINVCSADDPPRSVSICPGRRCVAFGYGAGIELHWVDEKSRQECRKHFPMSQPSEVLHFLPNRPETPLELRLISSLAGPGMPGCQCHNAVPGEKQPACQFHLLSGVRSFTRWTPGDKGNLSLVRATHCHHYRAIPINDGLHLLFIEPRTGLLCIGSDAPIGGPTSLTRALICVPPAGKETSDSSKDALGPTVFAAGSDLSWGLRIVAAYEDRIILYSVPLDVFNVVRRERERQGDGVMGDSDLARDWFIDGDRSRKRRESLVQNQNGDWEFLLSVSYRPTSMMWPFKIYGKEIGRMENIVELSLQSSYGGARVWAFSASGESSVIDIDTFTTNTQRPTSIPCKSFSIDSDGSVASARLVDRTDSGLLTPQSSRKRKHSEVREDFGGPHSTLHQLHNIMLDGFDPSILSKGSVQPANPAKRRPSFAACIVDFKIPELGAREGRWVENSCA